ncbi:TonB-dependent receptor [Flavihumibacter petaseus]|uniref:Putative TonB-dependent receptor n=1 Tax=Flavihumibacter petaseus NBRC 106054 TaxID=1220578 RepID=A0A0E9N5L2_9BACT|nr:TonB-dependent receptor [Flavihumibacter petaseus]GAO45257.1 putative TonB-dependent receptor [Flavihumibacter petaseus NBRC 106054]
MRHTKLLLTAFGLLQAFCLFAQSVITGTITDQQSKSPLQGVSVKVRGTRNGTITNDVGQFSLSAKPGDIFDITMIGYTSQAVTIGSESSISLALEPNITDLGGVVLVGTRRPGRVKIETPVPVDIVNVGQVALPTARMDLTSIMNYSAPSFNYNKQSGSDGADHIDLATLRGLGPDQTLVLVNGKRRHQTAFVAVFGTRGRGNSGTDLSALPMAAIDRVEILRDGASAQYGSDAIAGVINLVLKKNTGELTGNIGWSGYLDHKYNPATKPELGQYVYGNKLDGNALTANLNYGFNIGKNGGFMNLSGNFISSGKTYRQALSTDENSKDYLPTNIYRRAHGDGSLDAGGIFLNTEIPIAKTTTSFYAFGGYNHKFSDAYAFTRNWSARPDRFPTDASGELIEVPGIMQKTSDGEIYYNPHIQTKINDFSVATGFRGKIGQWDWDLSNTLGNNDFHFYGARTFNASIGPVPTSFDDGGFKFTQNTVNAGINRTYNTVLEGLNLSFGAELRTERYKIIAGEEGSYKNYDATGEKAGGAQGFPGYQPSDEINAKRTVVGVYADGELDITKKWLVGLATRFENYSDFGSTFNWKIATRYKITNNFNIRGSYSTGFRAPSLQQINFSSTFTTVQGTEIKEVKIAPNYSEITRAAGIPELVQEKSQNASLGFTTKITNGLSLTVDGYWVKVKDRVVLSGQFSAEDEGLDPILIEEMERLHVSLAQFFANAVNTTNKGIDLVLEYNKTYKPNRSVRALLTGNIQDMTIDDINVPEKLSGTADLRATFLTEREQKFILASAPNFKFGFTFEHNWERFGLGLRLTYFGKTTILGYGDGTADDFTPPFNRGDLYAYVPSDADGSPVKDQYVYNPKMTTDIYGTIHLDKKFTLYLGADNIFNVHPDLGFAPGAKSWAFNNETGGPWDAVQMGGNGLRFFARIGFKL